MGSDDTAITILGRPWVIDVFAGNGAPSGPTNLLFVDADRLVDSLWGRSRVGASPRPHAPVLGALRRALDPKLWRIIVETCGQLSTCPHRYPPMEALTHAA